MPTIKGAVHYTNIATPKKKYESNDTEYCVQVEVSKDQAKKWDDTFKKQKAKRYDTEEFKKTFKRDPQISEGDTHYIVTLKQDTHINGEPLKYKPKVFVANALGKLEDVTKKVSVGNGSLAEVQYGVIENSYGTFAKLKAMRVDTLIEFSTGGYDELGEVADSDDDDAGELGQESQQGDPADDDY